VLQVELTFIGAGSKVLGCEGNVTLSRQVQWLIQGLELAYGKQVKAKFLDLEKDEENPLVRRVKKEKCRLPLLLVNGEVKYEGGIPLAALKSCLEGMGIEPRNPMESKI